MKRDARIDRIFLDLHVAGAIRCCSEDFYPAGIPETQVQGVLCSLWKASTGQDCRGPAVHARDDQGSATTTRGGSNTGAFATAHAVPLSLGFWRCADAPAHEGPSS